MNESIKGWLEPQIAQAMRDLIDSTRPNVCVEIGVFAGKSLVNTASALKANGHGIVYGIDPWQREEAERGLSPFEDPQFWKGIDLDAVHYDCMREIWVRGLEEYAVVIRSGSQYCHSLFRAKSVDILYIDGGHSEESSCRDVRNYMPKVKVEGHIWFDDADWESTRNARGLILEACVLEKDYGNCHLYVRTK